MILGDHFKVTPRFGAHLLLIYPSYQAPFMATFKIKRPMIEENTNDDEHTEQPSNEVIWQSAIFKVGDDCRQDILALQLIAAMKSIFAEAGLHLYLFPYRIVATAPGVNPSEGDLI